MVTRSTGIVHGEHLTASSPWCHRCRAHVPFAAKATHVLPPDPLEMRPELNFVFGYCARCSTPMILKRIGEQEDVVFPRARRIDTALPSRVESVYQDVIKTMDAQAWRAAAVMIGRTLEAIGIETGCREKFLGKIIDELGTNGVLSAEFVDWSHQLQLTRNQGAHAADDVTKEEAEEALEFLEAILIVIYKLRPKFEKLKTRRAALP